MHNRHVVETLAKAGAVFVDETDEVPEGAIVVFSAHGVAPTVHASAAARNLQVIDATCPLVTKVHNEAKRFARDDYDILLIGHEGHEEVIGTAGEAPTTCSWSTGRRGGPGEGARREQGDLAVTDDFVGRRDHGHRRAAAAAVPETPGPAQRRHLLRHPEPPGRGQGDGAAVSAGDRGGLGQLVELDAAGGGGAGAGSRAAHLVDCADDIDPRWLDDVTTVGVTSGASVPEVLVRGVLERLAKYGYDVVQPVTTANETLVFALPREIRPARS
ncbi:lytB family protein [Mycobacterium xenopi 3993]|nr:lytB family protein [Mycobacterium xenopi 3993]